MKEGICMFTLGCHLSSTKGFTNMGQEAVRIGANTFQFFTRNPRGGKAKNVDYKDIERYLKFAEENNIGQILAHAPYTLNPCSADEGLREFAYNTMVDDIKRMELLPGNLYNFHPGSHVKQGVDKGITYISDMLNKVTPHTNTTTILLETMAGKGSEVGKKFEEIRAIIDRLEDSSMIGVCLDTCHIYDGGYDIVNDLDGVIKEFDDIIGLERLKAIHLNDSLNGFRSHKDRHAKIGEGKIGKETIVNVINHPDLRELVFNLETPNDISGYEHEIAVLRKLYV